MNGFNPWGYAAEHYPHITICTTRKLPNRHKGITDFKTTIWLCKTLDQAGRRFTLTHELIHLDRGVVVGALKQTEEHIVDKLAARLLVPFSELRGVVAEVEDLNAAASRLWVSPYALEVRLKSLTVEEQEILRELRRGELAS